MPYKRPSGCRQAFEIKNKIGKTQANRFFHIFLTHKSQELFTSPGGDAELLRLTDCDDQGTGSIHELGKLSCGPQLLFAVDQIFSQLDREPS